MKAMRDNYTFDKEEVFEMYRRTEAFDYFSSNWMKDDWFGWFNFDFKGMSVTVSLTSQRQESLKIYSGEMTFFLDDVYNGMEYMESGETNCLDLYDRESLACFAIQKIKEYFT